MEGKVQDRDEREKRAGSGSGAAAEKVVRDTLLARRGDSDWRSFEGMDNKRSRRENLPSTEILEATSILGRPLGDRLENRVEGEEVNRTTSTLPEIETDRNIETRWKIAKKREEAGK